MFTLFAPFIGGFFFSLWGYKDAYGSFPNLNGWLSIAGVGLILAICNYHSNVINQIFDKDIDVVHPKKKNRPIPSGQISSDEAFSLAIVLLIVAIIASLLMFGTFFTLDILLISAFSWIYNAPPLRLKKRFFWSNLGISVPRGGLGITCAYSAFSSPFNPIMYVAIIYFALYVFGTNTLKDFADAPYDKIAGVRNFVTVWGLEKASMFVGLFTVIPFVFLLGAIQFVAISMVSLFPFGLSGIMVYLLIKQADRESLEGNSLLWVVFYLQFSLMMILFALPRILS